jgi:hypothetical protein
LDKINHGGDGLLMHEHIIIKEEVKIIWLGFGRNIACP